MVDVLAGVTVPLKLHGSACGFGGTKSEAEIPQVPVLILRSVSFGSPALVVEPVLTSRFGSLNGEDGCSRLPFFQSGSFIVYVDFGFSV